MCGIVGAILKTSSGFTTQTETAFVEMLYADALRGMDSTGVIAIGNNGAYSILKEASQAAWFIPKLKEEPTFKQMWNTGKAWIGHNRKKTVGAIADETAHPFVVENTFAMVHNGTLHNHERLDKDAKTDSEALAIVLKKAFDQDDYLTALNNQLGDVWGAYALAFYDQKREKVFLLRNKDRPLWLIEADNAFYFSSEINLATWILGRNNYVYSKLEITPIPEHELISIDLQTNKVKKEAVTPKKYQTVTTPTKSMAVTGGGERSGVPSKEPLAKMSKSTFKFFKRKFLGKRISFWVDDWVEKNFPLTMEDHGETELMVFAESDDIKWTHSLSAIVDLVDYGFNDIDEVMQCRWSGLVEGMSLNEATGCCNIDISEAKPVIKSIPNVRDMFAKMLVNKSLMLLMQEREMHSERLTDWQLNLYNDAIQQRKEEVIQLEGGLVNKAHKLGLDAVLVEAKQKGITIEYAFDGDNHRWFNKETKEVLYESSTSIH